MTVIIINSHSVFLHLRARLEAFHAYLGDLISVKVKPSHFTGPSGLRNASVEGQENSCKTFTVCFFFSPDSTLTTVPQNSDSLRRWTRYRHIFNPHCKLRVSVVQSLRVVCAEHANCNVTIMTNTQLEYDKASFEMKQLWIRKKALCPCKNPWGFSSCLIQAGVFYLPSSDAPAGFAFWLHQSILSQVSNYSINLEFDQNRLEIVLCFPSLPFNKKYIIMGQKMGSSGWIWSPVAVGCHTCAPSGWWARLCSICLSWVWVCGPASQAVNDGVAETSSGALEQCKSRWAKPTGWAREGPAPLSLTSCSLGSTNSLLCSESKLANPFGFWGRVRGGLGEGMDEN